jgi:hypothetical protein
LEYGAEELQFCGFYGWVVGILYLLEKIAVVGKETWYGFIENKVLKHRDRKVSLANAAGANQKYASFIEGILFYKLGSSYFRRRYAALRPISVVGGKFTTFVAWRDVSMSK